METYHYKCQYCGKDYKPNRRKKQKYCSNSCRTRAFQIKNPKLGLTTPNVENKPEPFKVDKMSFAGVGNTIAGVAVVKLAETLFTTEDNKPATKKDFKEIKELLVKRYHQILNMNLDAFGKVPYYDIETKKIVYLKS
jgi:hypothetical protein